MKALLASVAALSALAMAAPASAADVGLRIAISSPGYSNGYANRSARQLQQLRLQVRQGIRYGVISNWEARRLYGRIHEVENLRYFYLRSRGGMSPWEARDLNGRIQQLRFEIRREFWDGRSYSRFDDRGFDDFDGDVRDHRGDREVRDHRGDGDGSWLRR
jgi:hypothetical protein